ncbi:MAG: hypothetical protein KAS32_21545, partial [Candidatus Peribacteraceae bacterium]|nr:hypothetical protein [Candidatus Peribacteraceae bacterium]
NGCPLHISLSPAILSRPQDGWYKLEFYLYNDPWGRSKGGEGDEDGNSFGLRVEDFQTKGNSLLQVLGTGSIINSEPPGSHDVNIAGSATVYANQGLVEIRDFRKFSTSHRSPGCDGSVICSMREACGNSEYKPYPNEPGLVTNKYGWILHHRIYPDSWEDVGGVSTRKKGYITTTGSPSGKPINFDENSIGNRRNEYAYLMYGPQNATKNIGGIYRCKDEWPSWEVECGNSANRYSYRKGSETVKCCYVSSDVGSNEDQTVTINHFSGYNYIINFLPPFGNSGDKLCAAVSNAGFFGWPVEMYRSNYTNQYCDEETGKGCCYCRPGWGCRLDCINELNMTGDEFSLPFAASGAFWELKDVRIDLSGTHLQSVIELTSTGGVTEGWEISAAVGEFADVVLDKNYTIPFNLFEDFGMKAPEDRGMYTLVLKINYTVEDDDRTVIPFNYMFSSVDCTKDGKSGNYYDSYTYPSTKGKGACQPGLRECIRLTDNDYRWQYSTLDDMPVYPTTETCNGIDDDCDGVIDDINSFEWVIDQIIASGGKKTPYEVTQCGCFMGAASSHEICNGVDDNCDGTVDDPEVNLWINTCDDAVKECMLEGSPYDWCRRLYNSTQCSLDQVTISTRANYSVNTCTAQVRDCMDNIHLYYVGDDYLNTNNLTYDECKYMYDDYSCFLDVQLFTTLGGTCRCTT